MAIAQNSITLTVEADEALENLMVWVDGVLVVSKYDWQADPPYNGHGWAQDGNRYTITLDRSLINTEPGSVVIVTSLWPTRDITVGTWIESAVTVT
jgi:hypothetical protein